MAKKRNSNDVSPTELLRSLTVVATPPVVVSAKVARTLHTIGPRLGMVVATRKAPKGQVKIWRLE
jgi:hypothetical protein